MSNYLKLTKDKLDIEEISQLVTESTTGAVSIFVGTTRDHFEGKRVLTLEYEAYEAMAVKKMEDLCQLTRSKWPSIHNIAIYHRLGTVGPKEASVVIALTSTHRQASLEALPFAIDTLKATIPIWKKEIYEDSSDWKSNQECPWSNQKGFS